MEELWVIVKNGDEITLDVEKRLLHLHASDKEIEKRKENKNNFCNFLSRGYVQLYQHHVEAGTPWC